MKNYTFSKNIHAIEGVYGVEFSSLEPNEESLFEINSHLWTSKLIQNVIDESIGLTDNKDLEFKAEGSSLFMFIDNKEVYFYNIHNNSEDPDFIWTFDKFITFMEDFKQFIEENQ